MLLHYFGKLKMQIFCIYLTYSEENANKLHYKCTNFNLCMWLCMQIVFMCTWNIKHTKAYLFFGKLCMALKRAGCCGSVNCAYVLRLFQQLINTMLCPAFLRKFACQPLCCGPLQIQTFYQNLVLVAEYHVDCWQALQWRLITLLWRISAAKKEISRVTLKFLFAISMKKDSIF